jgi:hypothetical protein
MIPVVLTSTTFPSASATDGSTPAPTIPTTEVTATARSIAPAPARHAALLVSPLGVCQATERFGGAEAV